MSRPVAILSSPQSTSSLLRRAVVLGLVLGLTAVTLLRPLDREALHAADCAYAVDRVGRPLGALEGDGCGWVSYADVAPELVALLVASEDKRFWHHPGVDVISVASALRERGSSRRRGASTLTMQLVRALGLTTRERTLRRKLDEVVLALRLERTFGKTSLIEEYLNRVRFGADVIGLVPACRLYFGKSPAELTFGEAGLLVAILPAPSRLDPRRNLRGACAQRDRLLQRLVNDAQLGGAATAALRAPCALSPSRRDRLAPHAINLLPPGRSGVVQTTLDLGVQAVAESALAAAASSLRKAGAHQGAMVVLDSQTSEVRALVGSIDFDDPEDGQINGAVLPRQAGSALKPFLYVEALRNGFTLETLIDDSPTEFEESGHHFTPQNSDGLFRGRITLLEALAQSRNVPAVRLTRAIGPPRFAKVLLEFGLAPLTHDPAWYGLGIGLGTAEVRLLDLAGAYATLGRGCIRLNPTLVPKLQVGQRVADADACNAVIEALRDEGARERGFGPAARLGFSEPVAIKTGTSTGARDMWLFAVTRQFTIGIWAGNFDMTPAGPDAAAMELLAPVARDLLRDLGVR